MPNKNLSTVATEVVTAYGITATNVINSYRFGGERLVGFVDVRFASVVNRGAAALRADLRSNLIGACYDPRQFGVIDPPYLRANRAVCPTAI